MRTADERGTDVNYLLLVTSVAATAVNNSLRNKFSKNALKSNADFFLFNSIVSAAALAVLLILGRGFDSASAFTVLLGILFGVIIAVEMIVALKALSIGPMSYTSLISLCGMLIPTFSGALFWDETIKPAQYVGIALLLVSFALGVNPKKDRQMSVKWILLCALLFCLSGSMGVIQKVHQTSRYSGELSECLITAFATTLLILLVAGGISVSSSKRTAVRLRSGLGACAAVCGVCTALIHNINIYLSGVMDSAFFFPVINGACIMVTILASVVLFKEKLSRLQVVSLILGVAAILLIGNITDLIAA